MTASFNALSQLRERFIESHHDFRGTTNIFPSLDVDKVASDLELEEKGQERGQKNQPPSGSKGYDETELAVIERVEDEKKESHNTMNGEKRTSTGARSTAGTVILIVLISPSGRTMIAFLAWVWAYPPVKRSCCAF